MAVESTELPAPRADLPDEIRFRRLLTSCQRLFDAHGSSQSSSHSSSDIQLTKLKHFFETLQEQLSELERSHAMQLGFNTLSLYKKHVDALAERVPHVPLPRYCQKPRKPVLPAAKGLPSQATPPMFMPGPPRASGSEAGDRSDAAAASSSGLSAALSEAARKRVGQQEGIHEALTDELVEMAAAMKRSTLGVQAAVDDRGSLVDATEQHLNCNLESAKDVLAKSKQQHKTGGGTFCLTLLVLLVVGLVLSAMIVYIKFTHLLGYRSRPGGAGTTLPSLGTAPSPYSGSPAPSLLAGGAGRMDNGEL